MTVYKSVVEVVSIVFSNASSVLIWKNVSVQSE